MLSLILSFALSISVYFKTAEYGNWSILWAILTFLLLQVLVGLALRKPIMGVQNKIQAVIMDGQKKLNAKMTQMQQRGAGSVKVMQKILESEQTKFIEEALALTSELETYNKWSIMMSKQIATMRMQFYFQLKDFKKVDELMPKAMFMDPMIYGMKLARQYKQDDLVGMEKTFKKAMRRFKGEKATIIVAAYSWAMVKKNNIDDAIKALNEAVKKNSNEVLVNNLNALRNGKLKLFSNAGLGDMWYTLYLEEPKQKVARVKQRASKGGRPF